MVPAVRTPAGSGGASPRPGAFWRRVSILRYGPRSRSAGRDAWRNEPPGARPGRGARARGPSLQSGRDLGAVQGRPATGRGLEARRRRATGAGHHGSLGPRSRGRPHMDGRAPGGRVIRAASGNVQPVDPSLAGPPPANPWRPTHPPGRSGQAGHALDNLIFAMGRPVALAPRGPPLGTTSPAPPRGPSAPERPADTARFRAQSRGAAAHPPKAVRQKSSEPGAPPGPAASPHRPEALNAVPGEGVAGAFDARRPPSATLRTS